MNVTYPERLAFDMQLLLLTARIGFSCPTAVVSAFEAATVGRAFQRRSVWYTFNTGSRAMVVRCACAGWEDVREFLKAEGYRCKFQPWIDGSLERVAVAPTGGSSPRETMLTLVIKQIAFG